jgi:hypothetical protein
MTTAAATADDERMLQNLIINLIVAPKNIAAAGSPHDRRQSTSIDSGHPSYGSLS